MEYNNEKFVWYCNECKNTWFHNSGYLDLCDRCESEHIFDVEITDSDKETVIGLRNQIQNLKDELIKKEENLRTEFWLKMLNRG